MTMQSSVLPLLLGVGPALLLLLQLPFKPGAQEVHLQDYKYGRPQWEASSCSWQCLLLTLQWPAAFCQVSSISLRRRRSRAEELLLSCRRWTQDVFARFPRASTHGPSTACGSAVT